MAMGEHRLAAQPDLAPGGRLELEARAAVAHPVGGDGGERTSSSRLSRIGTARACRDHPRAASG
jgi:hypothetical protein